MTNTPRLIQPTEEVLHYGNELDGYEHVNYLKMRIGELGRRKNLVRERMDRFMISEERVCGEFDVSFGVYVFVYLVQIMIRESQ
jgi:hypothetical protein